MKIKAFTILEMIINLAIMSIIAGMVYVITSQFQRNVENYSDLSQEDFKVRGFYALMQEDFYASEKIIAKSEFEVDVVFYNETKVNYKQIGNKLLRTKENQPDAIEIKNFEINYLNENLGEFSEKLVDHITITAVLFKDEAPLMVYKNYLSNFLIYAR